MQILENILTKGTESGVLLVFVDEFLGGMEDVYVSVWVLLLAGERERSAALVWILRMDAAAAQFLAVLVYQVRGIFLLCGYDETSV
mmetsp:Transcript_55386/g.66717  ORF Transcript_55386/g.66717 Transcript_55386/m.66717 type:complete len:86 (+) Transcript_55386:23-280(+)